MESLETATFHEAIRARLAGFRQMKAEMDRQGLRSESLDAYVQDVALLLRNARHTASIETKLSATVAVLEGHKRDLAERVDALITALDESERDNQRLHWEIEDMQKLLDDCAVYDLSDR